MADTLKSFDARVWAKDFCDIARKIGQPVPDEEWMVTWFANALMRGYDEHRYSTKEYKRSIRHALFPWWHPNHWTTD